MINVPVFSDENGTPQICMYSEDEDGTFRRTQSEPLRLLRDDIKGISISQGDIVTPTYDRYEREWNTPTVTFHYGRPQSFYQFLRGKVVLNRFFVFTKPQLAGHLSRLSLHELQLKNSVSQRKIAILKEKYIEAVELWSEQQLESQAKKDTAAPRLAMAVPSSEALVGLKLTAHAETAGKKHSIKPSATVSYFRRDKSGDGTRSQPSADKTLLTAVVSHNPVERDFNKRKNLIQEFSLPKPQPTVHAEQKAHNKHFFKRFIRSLD